VHGNEKTLTFSNFNFASKKNDNNLHLFFKMANTLVTSIGTINNTSQTPLALDTNYDTKYATYLKLFSGK